MRGVFLLTTLILCGLLWQIHRYTRDVLGCSLGDLYHHIRHLGEGRSLPAIPQKQDRQDTILGWLVDTARQLDEMSMRNAEAMAELKHQSIIDPLTRLPNRRALVAYLDELLPKQAAGTFHLAYLDLDGFKPVNDLYGHAAGDHVLCEVAAILRDHHDTADFVARIGGDEFVLVLIQQTDPTRLQQSMDQLITRLGLPVDWHGHQLQVTASIGLTAYTPSLASNADQLISLADHAMYQAKLAGKNRCIIETAADRLRHPR